MKKLLAQKQTFQKFKPYDLGHIKTIDKPGQMVWSELYIKILGVILLILLLHVL